MIEKIRQFLRRWLFGNEINLLMKLEDDRVVLYEAVGAYRNAYGLVKDAGDLVSKCVDVGVDVNMRDYSWAVVCIKGKPEYVRFMRLSGESVHEVMRFLKMFEESHPVVDAHPVFRRFRRDMDFF